MSRNWLFSVLCIASAVVFTQLASAGNSLRVNESATRFLVQDQTLVELEINNPVKQSLPVRVSLDLLTPKDVMCARAMRDLTLSAGVNKITLPLSFFDAAAKTYDDDEILWYRLRYNVSPTNDSTTAGSQGLISLSQIQTPDIFAVHMSTPRGTHEIGRASCRERV